MNWSITTWAPLPKSPNWASHHQGVGHLHRVPVLETDGGELGEQRVDDAHPGELAGRALQRDPIHPGLVVGDGGVAVAEVPAASLPR